MAIQILAYESGLLLLLVWWMRVAGVGGHGMLGCCAWMMLAFASAIAIVTSSYK